MTISTSTDLPMPDNAGQTQTHDRTGEKSLPVRFLGQANVLRGMMFGGLLKYLPTLGLYRFWLLTKKRQFYWSNTMIDGDALEYTGTAKQLLIGFLVAVLFFVPVYGGLFLLSLRDQSLALIGYGIAGVLVYFLIGYAIYRSRRFKLTRTLWRGIRFGQSGSAWHYALRRFGWTLLNLVTLGLAMPFMSADLWRYRINNTWLGDRQFSFQGSWRDVAKPFYKGYALVVAFALVGVFLLMSEQISFRPGAGLLFVLSYLVGVIGLVVYHARTVSRFGSKIAIGDAHLSVHVKARSIFWLYFVYFLTFCAASLVIGIIVFVLSATIGGGITAANNGVPAFGIGSIVVTGLSYLLYMMALTILGELIIMLGMWKLMAEGTQIINAASLADINAAGAESSIVGEGLADALEIGAY